MSIIEEAWRKIVENPVEAKGAYVCLIGVTQRYGGPEEGGWWYRERRLIEYRYFDTREQAEACAEAVRKTAKQMTEENKRQYGRQMQESCEWLDARGLDADYLPEPDSHEDIRVDVRETLPEYNDAKPHYE